MSQSSQRYLCDISKLPVSYGLTPNASLKQTGGKSYKCIYDKLNRLESGISRDGNNESIVYDVMGNIERLTWYDTGNLVVYDVNGNMSLRTTTVLLEIDLRSITYNYLGLLL